MRRFAAAIGVALASVVFASSVHAQDYSPAAKRVLQQARAASGGAGWNTLRGWRETGVVGGNRYESWADPVRYGFRIEIQQPAGRHTHGFNGAGDWEIAPSGAVTGVDDRLTVARARTTAYLAAKGYFFPSRFEAQGEYLGVKQSEGRSFDVITMHPKGGTPRELWFDSRTHLLGRIVDRTGPRPIVEALSDYRRAGPVMAAFRATIDESDPALRQERRTEAVTFPVADRSLFSLPRPPGLAPPPAAPAAPIRKPPAKKR